MPVQVGPAAALTKGGSMKRLQVLVMAALLLAGGWLAEVQAAGFGMYGTLGWGEVEIDGWDFPFGDDDAGGTSREHSHLAGVGMALDSAVARDRLFNYRLNIGYEEMTHDKGELDSFVMDHDFGFALYRSEAARLWFGPELRTSWGSHDTFGFGIGPVLGLNLHTGPEISIALKGGYLVTGFAGGDWPDDEEEDFEDYEEAAHAFVNLAIFFRSPGDRF